MIISEKLSAKIELRIFYFHKYHKGNDTNTEA